VNVYESNNASDQFSGFGDPRSITEDVPPEIDVTSEETIFDGSAVTVGAADSGGIEGLWAKYRRPDASDPVYADTDLDGTSHEMGAGPPDGSETPHVWAIDDHRNTFNVTIDIQDDGSDEVLNTKVSVGRGNGCDSCFRVFRSGELGSDRGHIEYRRRRDVHPAISRNHELGRDDGHLRAAGAGESTVEEYTSNELASGVESAIATESVVLTEGYAQTVSVSADPAGIGVERGYGSKYIEKDSSGIGHVLGAGFIDAYEYGDRDLILGDNEAGDQVLIEIVGGVIQAVHDQPARNAECDDRVIVENEETRDDNPDYTLGINREG